jgi:hypothetical protein
MTRLRKREVMMMMMMVMMMMMMMMMMSLVTSHLFSHLGPCVAALLLLAPCLPSPPGDGDLATEPRRPLSLTRRPRRAPWSATT